MEEELDMNLFGLFNETDEDTTAEDNSSDTDVEDSQDNPFINNDNSSEAESEDSGEVGHQEQEDRDEGDNSEEDEASSSNLYSSIAGVLQEQGLLPSLNLESDKVESIDDFVNIFKREADSIAQSKVDEIINNLDLEKIASHKININNLSEITNDMLANDINMAKRLIREDYINQGFDQAKVDRLVNRLSTLGDDAILEDAAESLSSLKAFNARKIEEERDAYQAFLEKQAKELEESDARIKKHIYEKDDLIDGLKPTKAMRDSVYKSITEVVGKDPQGNLENQFMKDRRENPVEFETRMYYMYTLTNGFKDFSKLIAPAKSSAISELEKAFKKSRQSSDNGLPAWAQDPDSYGGQGDFILNI